MKHFTSRHKQRGLFGVDRALLSSNALTRASLLASARFVANFGDLGAGAVDLTLYKGQGPATFTRATTAWTKLSTGLWASVGSGTARSCYQGMDTTVGAYGGYLSESVRTNLCLQARDLSTTWTALNATLLKDQVGIDGVTNSASSMLATAGNGSALQTITEAATASALSMFIKRITGTGTITIQQGASTLEVSGSINSSTYTRVELDATVLNPAIGIVLGTNGDKIAVDMVQFENGVPASSPIPTTTVAVTRNADVLWYPVTGNIATVSTPFAVYVEAMLNGITGSAQVLLGANATFQLYFRVSNGAASGLEFFSNNGGADATLAYSDANKKVFTKYIVLKDASNNLTIFEGGTAGTATAAGAQNAEITQMHLGDQNGGSSLFGMMRNVRLYSGRALTSAQAILLTTGAP